MATTISISEEMRDKLKNLGRAGDSYEDVLEKLYNVASKQMLMTYLYDESDSISIQEARRRLARGKSHHN